ncbi:secretion system protein E [Leptotrichia sp. OH3620_COT-345]|uniref:ATPase, T2SS/T4P/T4SS family n=1 Tax=Leptotrichia sp. OH3620_COT-345 TaxID=2491048 RepID=UPI000F653BA9|nr:ATPase, T2SS/T4P/T4SS family [Leptotrichia sp. OH3620_COT-345]RRD40368.1 secretion system protein E [Leptotrichia sp. OH3620_COT-345]
MTEAEKRDIDKRKKINFLNENLGDEILDLLDREDINEISVNQDGKVWIDIAKEGYVKTETIYDNLRRKTIIEVIASFNGKSANNDTPIVSATLPNKERFEGILGEPVDDKPVFSIRKPSRGIIPLENFFKAVFEDENGEEIYDILSKAENSQELIKMAILNRANILVNGGTSSGKTSLTNAMIQLLNGTKDRIITIEDTRELNCRDIENKVMLRTTETVSAKDLLRSCMRLNPDRIFVGELRRGEETIELLKAWNSGHPGGISTIHANTNQSALKKVEQYLGEVSSRKQIGMILEAVNIVVNITKQNTVRGIKEIALVKGYDYEKKEYILEKIN